MRPLGIGLKLALPQLLWAQERVKTMDVSEEAPRLPVQQEDKGAAGDIRRDSCL